MARPNLYRVTNITTGEVWEDIDSQEIAERIHMSHVTVRKYASLYGRVKNYKIDLVFKEKRAQPKPGMKSLLAEWDKFVPKLNQRIIKQEAI